MLSYMDSPRPLQLTPIQELTAMAHQEILKLNGFEVLVDENRPAGERVQLVTLPVLKGCQFSEGGRNNVTSFYSLHDL